MLFFRQPTGSSRQKDHPRRLLWPAAALLVVVFATGCSELNYYRQAAFGQWQLLAQRRDIEELLADRNTSAELKERLALVQDIRDFAVSELLLPDNRSYRTYADLGRSHAVWNVVATPALSLKPVTWCFPVAGCVPYRGYFNPEAAHHFARRLEEQGHDVYVYGVAAYSTLNWFDDPVLSTFIHYSEPYLAGLLFHELAHQKLYVKDDGTFNESFARAVELVGVERWLQQRNRPEQLRAYQLERDRGQEFVDLILRTRSELDRLYQSDQEQRLKLTAKQELLEQFRDRYRELKQSWEDDSRFDSWVNRPLNNAHFALAATYQEHVQAFHALLDRQGGDLAAFYAAAAELAALSREDRNEALQSHH